MPNRPEPDIHVRQSVQQHMFSRRRALRLGIAGLVGTGIGVLLNALRRPVGEVGAIVRGASPTVHATDQALQSRATSRRVFVTTPTYPSIPAPDSGASPTTIVTPPATPTSVSSSTPTSVSSTSTPQSTQAAVSERPTARIGTVNPVAKPAIISRAEWKAVEPTRRFLPQIPRFLTLHHEGVYFDGSSSASEYLYRIQRWSITNRQWPDIPYHFLIDIEGHIFEGRPLDARGDTNTSYDLQDHALVALLGKYDAADQNPNADQISSIIKLMAWIVKSYNIPLDLIRGHREYIPFNKEKRQHIDPLTGEKVTCPGDNLYQYLADHTIQNGIADLLGQPRQESSP